MRLWVAKNEFRMFSFGYPSLFDQIIDKIPGGGCLCLFSCLSCPLTDVGETGRCHGWKIAHPTVFVATGWFCLILWQWALSTAKCIQKGFDFGDHDWSIWVFFATFREGIGTLASPYTSTGSNCIMVSLKVGGSVWAKQGPIANIADGFLVFYFPVCNRFIEIL